MKFLYITLFLASCCSTGEAQDVPSNDEITDRVICTHDSTQQYALFLPSTYTDATPWPVIFFFEPAARARLPLEKYQVFGEKYGYIMVCSYNSRNGPDQPIFDAANAMYTDVLERFEVDEDRIILSGFSGGARISCVIGLSNSKIDAVVGCGAGFPYSDSPDQKINFDYMAIIGKQDMNYNEIVVLDSILDEYCNNHLMETFPKGHQWPDTGTFHKAFYWLETSAMRTGSTKTNSLLLKEIRFSYKEQLELAEKEGRLIDQALILKNIIALLDGLMDIKDLAEKRTRLIESKAYLEALKTERAIKKKEFDLQKKYIHEFEQISLLNIYPEHQIKSKTWWKKEFNKINEMQDQDLVARINEFLINGSWEQQFNSMRLKRYTVAISFLHVYEAGLPDKPSPYYLLAIAHASSGNSLEMYRYLNKAIDKGLKDPDLLTDEYAFQPFLKEKKFQKLLEQISQAENE